MNTDLTVQGIRILDKTNNVVGVSLVDILELVESPDSFQWNITYLEAMGRLDNEKTVPEFENEINNSEDGLVMTWVDLKRLATKFWQIINITICASSSKNDLKRYDSTNDMACACDIVIEMIDSSYWEVYAKDATVIKAIQQKFLQTELINP